MQIFGKSVSVNAYISEKLLAKKKYQLIVLFIQSYCLHSKTKIHNIKRIYFLINIILQLTVV